jgi:hypothetical protein
MPLVRGRLLPEVELAGRAKQFLDILLWADDLSDKEMAALDELDHLRIYLASLRPFVCGIRIFVTRRHARTVAALNALQVRHHVIDERQLESGLAAGLGGLEEEMLTALGTALSVDADCLATDRHGWFPWIEEVEKLGFLLTDCAFLLPYSEIFSRGHDVPWSFRYKSWYAPWTAFYTLSEESTFKPGLDMLQKAYRRAAPKDAQETGRTLVHNRLPNLCFTRDRLLFYEVQRLAAKRAGWKRQQFTFEIAYALNFYYILIYGAFDHAAVLASQLLQLGLLEKDVGATYKSFLRAVEKKSGSLLSIFTDPANKEFIERIGYLRHYAAHRGTLMPAAVYQELDHEPTADELDADIRDAGLDCIIERFPPGASRESFREMFRNNARMARYEKGGKVLDRVVWVELGGKPGFINPLLDTSWNFRRVIDFLNAIFEECSRQLT